MAFQKLFFPYPKPQLFTYSYVLRSRFGNHIFFLQQNLTHHANFCKETFEAN
ncbi:hypothetical protein ACRRTK_020938 [Alexandromys fortis]